MPDAAIPNPIKKSELLSFRSPKPQGQPHQQQQGHDRPTKSSVDIIRASSRNENPQGDPETLIKQIALMVQRKIIQLLQIGDTVFVLYPKADGVVEFHTFTTEPPQVLAKRYKAGVNSLRHMGFKKAVSVAESPAFVRIAQSTGVPVQISRTSIRSGNEMKPGYRFEVTL